MKFLPASLLPFLLILVLKSASDEVYVESAVGLYGPDRYEGLSDSCLLPMDFGYCRAKIQRYYFDIRRMKCTMFYWGGCAGNDNNFKSMDECNDFCSSGHGYDETNSVVPLKRERVVNNPTSNDYNANTNAKYTALSSRGSSISKTSPPKFTVKSASTSRDISNSSSNNNNGTLKASPKSFNVNPTTKQYKYPATTTDNLEDEEYDD